MRSLREWGSRADPGSVRHTDVTDELPMRCATPDDLPELSTFVSGAFLHDPEEETLDLFRLVD